MYFVCSISNSNFLCLHHDEDPEDTHTAGLPTPILSTDLPTTHQTTADPSSGAMTTASSTTPSGDAINHYGFRKI